MINKGIYAAPMGLGGMMGIDPLAEPMMEIEIEDPESVSINTGGLEIILEPGAEDSDSFSANLAEYMDDNELVGIASDLVGEVEGDLASRRDWLDTYVDGIELLGMKMEDRTEPWEGACNVYHPLLSETLVRFQAETMMETFPAAGPVKTQIIGRQTPENMDAAVRVKDDMNYQLTEAMPEYRPEHERMLWGLGLAGNAFKKVYFDPSLERQVSVFVPAEDMVVPYGASNLETSPRVTHIMRKTKNELRRLQVSGFYRDIDLGDPSDTLDDVEKKIAEKMGFNATMDDRYKVLEIHVDLDLPGYEDVDDKGHPTGIALPYVVTIEKGTATVLAIRRNWHPDDHTKQKRQHFVHYGYIPGFGFYCFGIIHLIGSYAKSGTMLLRQLVDAGTLSNLPGGFKTKGLRVKGDDTPISPGEFRDVDVPSGTIKDNLMPLPYKEPSMVLQSLMNQIIDEARRFASAADIKVSDMSANSPVGTTLAILERTLKVMSAIQARVHYAMKQEFKLLKNIIRDYTPPDYSYEPDDGGRRAKQADYDLVEVIPVSDPNAATMSQKVVQYQAVMQMAQQAPQVYDLVELNRQMLEVLGIKNINKLVPNSDEQKPRDPISENMAVLKNKPVKAFLYQDHKAHIQVHMMAMQDPKIAQLIGQNPMAQQIQAAAMAHINEHIAFEYRKQMEEQIGVTLPPEEDQMPEEMEVEVSRLAAQAAARLLQKNTAEVQQKQAQETAQDPLVQMQQKELELREAELRLKAEKQQSDFSLDTQRIQLDKERINSQERIAGFTVGAKVAQDSKSTANNDLKEVLKYASDELIKNQQMTMQDRQQADKVQSDMAKHRSALQNQASIAAARDATAKEIAAKNAEAKAASVPVAPVKAE